MITWRQTLAVVASEVVVLAVVVAGWNAWAYRAELIGRGRALVHI